MRKRQIRDKMNEIIPIKYKGQAHMRPTAYRLFLAEFLGTFFLLFIGLGAVMLSIDPGTVFSGQGSAVQMSAFSPLSQALILYVKNFVCK